MSLYNTLAKFVFLTPSIGVFLFYNSTNYEGILPFLIDSIIFIFPIILGIVVPGIIMYQLKPYREYLLGFVVKFT